MPRIARATWRRTVKYEFSITRTLFKMAFVRDSHLALWVMTWSHCVIVWGWREIVSLSRSLPGRCSLVAGMFGDATCTCSCKIGRAASITELWYLCIIERVEGVVGLLVLMCSCNVKKRKLHCIAFNVRINVAVLLNSYELTFRRWLEKMKIHVLVSHARKKHTFTQSRLVGWWLNRWSWLVSDYSAKRSLSV